MMMMRIIIIIIRIIIVLIILLYVYVYNIYIYIYTYTVITLNCVYQYFKENKKIHIFVIQVYYTIISFSFKLYFKIK